MSQPVPSQLIPARPVLPCPGLPRDELDRLIAHHGPAGIAAAMIVALRRHRRARVAVLGPGDIGPLSAARHRLPPAGGRLDHLRHL